MKKNIILLGIAAGLFTACSSNTKTEDTESKDTVAAAPAAAAVPASDDTAWMGKDGLYARIYTSKGLIVCKLENEKTPLTVANFAGLAEGSVKNSIKKAGQPFYDGLTFHRVEPGFVIQGGDPQGNGQGGPGYEFDNEISQELSHNGKGILAMANAGPGTNGSQFYITHKALPQLDMGGAYTVFGHTVTGLSVIDQIAIGDKIDSIRITRVGAAVQSYDPAAVFTANMNKVRKSFDDRVAERFPTAKKTASGLYYIVEKEGKGAKAVAGKTVAVNYTGTFWDGRIFDSSVGKAPIEFPLGTGRVIPGWDEGIALMKVGSKVKLIIPYQLAYGPQGNGPIPPKADLIFDTELMSVK